MSRVTVSIVTYKALDRAKKCVEAVLKHSGDARLILTSNGNIEALKFFQTVSHATAIWNETNLGFGRAHNRAFALCDTEFFVCLNDDTEPPSGWLEALRSPFDRDPNAALASPANTCSQIKPNFHGSPGVREYCEGSCLMVRASVARKHGLFDETLPGLAYGEDSDLSLRYREKGYGLNWVPLDVKHVGSVTSRQTPEVAKWQADNHRVLMRRWTHYMKVRTFNYPIVLKRTGAMGDCLLMTPVIAQLKADKPLSPIMVETNVPEIFQGNPHVARAATKIRRDPNELRIDLDGSYEAEPEKHFVETYARKVGVTLQNTTTHLHCTQADRQLAVEKISAVGWIAIHAGPVNWENKQWAAARFAAVSEQLRARGKKIVLVGTMFKDRTIPCDLDLRGRTTPHQLAAILDECELLVGLDSFPMHAAQAVGTPVVALFGVTLPGPIMTDGSKWLAVTSDPSHPGSGLRHKIKNKVFTPTKGNPMETIAVEQVMSAVDKMLVPEPVVAMPDEL